MTALPVLAQPDAEAWVWSAVNDIPGVTTFSVAAVHDHIGWLVAHTVQADARAATKQAARDRAELVRQRIFALQGSAWTDGACVYSQPVEGPFWLPDDDGSARYTARYELRVHPFRAESRAPMARAAAARRVGRKRK